MSCTPHINEVMDGVHPDSSSTSLTKNIPMYYLVSGLDNVSPSFHKPCKYEVPLGVPERA
jgi:hypothetical protein